MSVYIYNGDVYNSRPPQNGLGGYLVATAASSVILSPLVYINKPYKKQLLKEEMNNSVYKDALYKALQVSGLDNEGVKIIPAQYQDVEPIYKEGLNACYIPKARRVLLNTDKISSAGFHELGHALNNLKSKYGVKYLAKMRYPGYAIAGLMEYFALFSRTKPKSAPRNISDFIEDNCGKIAFLAMLPIVAEETIASYRGIKLAKDSRLPEHLVKNMKKLFSKALATYAGRAVLGGFAIYASRKIMDYCTRPQKIENFDLFA